MKTSASGLSFLRHQEGLARWDPVRKLCFPYRDQVGKLTIGVGHLIRAEEDFTDGITEERCMQLLAGDVLKCELAIDEHVTAPLNQNQFDMLVDWSFNNGIGVLSNSTLVRRLNLGAYDEVPELLKAWCRADGKVLPVLVQRRVAEGKVWSTPVDLTVEEVSAIMADVQASLRDAVDPTELGRSEDNP